MTSSVSVADEFLAQTRSFNRRSQELGLGDVSRYYWYHTVDLGNGLVTPGLYDYRETLDVFRFPEDLQGKRVLDVGSATGYFAFEFAKRGAQVVSVELPSLEQLDRFPGQDTSALLWKIERMIVPDSSEAELQAMKRRYSAEELWFNLLDGPFRFCQERLGLPVQRCFSSVYDLTQANTGGEKFDLVFIGDVLVHTLYPLKALAAAADLCRGTLVLAQLMPEAADGQAAMVYVGGDDPQEDHVSWWEPNKPCFVQMLKKLRFGRVEDVGHHTGLLRPAGFRFDRTILHAAR